MGGVVLYRGTLSSGAHTVGISSGQWSDYFVVEFFASLGTGGSTYFAGDETVVRFDRYAESAKLSVIYQTGYFVDVTRVGDDQLKLNVSGKAADILVVGYSYADN